MSKSTPWGPAQHQDTIAPGIVRYSTAGHGGIHLSADRLAQLPAELRAFGNFNGEGWYEEDCDWAIPAVAFPHSFQPSSVAGAVRTILGSRDYFKDVATWLEGDSAQAKEARSIAEAWRAANAGRYRIACSGSIPRRHEELAKKLQPSVSGSLSWCLLRRISDGAEVEALLLFSEQREPIDLATIPAERVIVKEAA